jgi:hypothetical protein
MKPYELLIRSNALGEYQGAHVIDKDGDLPRPIESADWPDIVEGINQITLEKSQSYDRLFADFQAIKLTLDEHQRLTDQGMTEAKPLIEELIATGSGTAIMLGKIFEKFAEYGTGRARAKLSAEAADLEAKLLALTAELEAKRQALIVPEEVVISQTLKSKKIIK